jgi:hypothetical protein
MFNLFGRLINLCIRGVNIADNLTEAAEVQTEIVRDSSLFSAKKKRLTLDAEMAAFEKQLAEEPVIKAADLKAA